MLKSLLLTDHRKIDMDFIVTVRTYTGAVKSVEVNNMPDEEAAAAEAVGLTFGRVMSIERTDVEEEAPKPKKKKIFNSIEKELKPGETQTVITGYNHNPLALFNSLNDDVVGF